MVELMIPWLKEEPNLGPTALGVKVKERFSHDGTMPYMKLYNAREKALERINSASWDESFRLLYTFKAEVEKASPGSVVEIEYHKEEYTVGGKKKEKIASEGLLFVSRLARMGF